MRNASTVRDQTQTGGRARAQADRAETRRRDAGAPTRGLGHAHAGRGLLALFAMWAGCGGAPAPADAGPGDAGLRIAEPAPPAPVAPPVLTPCPTGWRERLLPEGVTICEPWTQDSAPACAADELALVGTGCVRLDDCPAGGWPADLPPSGVVYARAGATGGDGTRNLPYGTLLEAVAAAPAGSTIALAEGEYAGGFESRTPVAIRGACAARTIVRDPRTEPNTAAVIVLGTFSLRGVRLIGGNRALWVSSGARATVSESVLEGGAGGVRLDTGTTLEGDRVRISAPTTDPGEFALGIRPMAHATLRRSSVIGGGAAAIGAATMTASDDGSRVTLEDVAILDTTLALRNLHFMSAQRVTIERAVAGAVVPPAGDWTLSDVRMREVGRDGGGLLVIGSLRVERLAASRFELSALVALRTDAGTGSIEARDVVAEDRASISEVVGSGGQLRLERALIARVGGSAVMALEGGSIDASDVRVVDTVGGESQGDGLVALSGGTLTVDRAHVVRGARLAVAVAGLDSRAIVRDLEVEDTPLGASAQCDGECDLEVASLELERVRMRRVYRGVSALEASVQVRDLDIEDVHSLGSDGHGAGLLVMGARLSVERARVVRGTNFAVLALLGSTLAAADLRVLDTEPGGCAGCPIDSFGDALVCATGSSVDVSRFELAGAHRAGFLIGQGCVSAVLRTGSIHDNGVGVLRDESTSRPELIDVGIEQNTLSFDETVVVLTAPDIRF